MKSKARPWVWTVGTFALLAAASVAQAHPGHLGHEATGLWQGFAHPLSGLDHILAMVAVGLLAAQRGGRALWALPASFLGAMIVGGAVGAGGLPVPGVEHVIIASVLILGAMIALSLRVPLGAAAAVVAACAFFHGHAHGTEMPEAMSGAMYGAGFLLATASLHAAGLAGGLAMRALRARIMPAAVRGAGVAIVVAGAAMLFAAVIFSAALISFAGGSAA